MARIGSFDQGLSNLAWFDETGVVEGWFDDDLIGAPLSTGIVAAGIPSAEAFGQPSLAATITAAGIATAEAFGQPSLAAAIMAAGIASAEAIGRPIIGAAVVAAAGMSMLLRRRRR
jgi:hypothetical protein